MLGSSTPDPGDAEKYESIVALSDRRVLRKVILPRMCNNIYQTGFWDLCALLMCWLALCLPVSMAKSGIGMFDGLCKVAAAKWAQWQLPVFQL